MQCAERQLDLSVPQVMGVLNVTPDSFSDGGLFIGREKALDHARYMADAGAAIIDVGGESARPGALPVSVQEELDRVLPIVEALSRETPCLISVDTSTPEVMLASAKAGAHLINDVRALSREGAMAGAVAAGLPVCLMHMQGQPATMQQAPVYHDVVSEVYGYLEERITLCLQAGIAKDQLLVDPGFGFGKTLEHNLQLLKYLSAFGDLGCPVLVGLSRKSMLGTLLNKPVQGRLAGSLALALLAIERGANIVRVHDVEETVDAVKVIQSLRACD